MEDKDFKNIVRNIANGSNDNRETVLMVSGYFWDSINYERLSETPFGRFLREHPVNNDSPDLSLLSIYRDQVLSSKE